MTDAETWDRIARTKTAERAAYDTDDDATEHHLNLIAGQIDRHGPVIEIGCGPGRLLRPLAVEDPDRQYVGIDPSTVMTGPLEVDQPDNISIVRHPDDIRTGDAALVYSMLVFQHLQPATVDDYLNRIGGWLRPGGRFIFQYVEGREHGPTVHEVAYGRYERTISPPLTVTYTIADRHQPNWRWVRGRKDQQ